MAASAGEMMHIEIRESARLRVTSYEVRVVDTDGRTIRTFTYPTIEAARVAACAWTVAYGNCRIDDKTRA